MIILDERKGKEEGARFRSRTVAAGVDGSRVDAVDDDADLDAGGVGVGLANVGGVTATAANGLACAATAVRVCLDGKEKTGAFGVLKEMDDCRRGAGDWVQD